MTKESFQKAMDLIIANWNLQVAGARRLEMEKTWWRYMRDLPDEAVLKAIDILVVRDGPPPRSGTVRRLAMENNPLIDIPPEPAEAWVQTKKLLSNLEAGIVLDSEKALHPLVIETIRTGVRDYKPFMELYASKLQAWRDTMFGVK